MLRQEGYFTTLEVALHVSDSTSACDRDIHPIGNELGASRDPHAASGPHEQGGVLPCP